MFQRLISSYTKRHDNMALRMRELHRHVLSRDLGKSQARTIPPASLDITAQKFACRKLPRLLKERELKLEAIDKIFAANWLNERQVVVGSKCNKLIVLDAMSGHMTEIPSLRSSDDSRPADNPYGIHAISINPSRSLLATGGHNTNDLAIYQLPTFDPVCTGEKGHGNVIFDIKWLDDEFVVSGSRDGSLCLWRIKESDMPEQCQSSTSELFSLPDLVVKHHLTTRTSKDKETVRALAVSQAHNEFGALSPNGAVSIWDIKNFTLKRRFKPNAYHTNVCMAKLPGKRMYAIGSEDHIELLDPRTKAANFLFTKRGCGVRSVSFLGEVMTIGTLTGAIYFIDLRNRRVIPCGKAMSLQSGRGGGITNAIFAHCFDETGTKLFAAGGPAMSDLYGNYSGIWQ